MSVEIWTRLNDRGELEVRQRLVNQTDGEVSFHCELFAPGRRRQQTQVIDLAPGPRRAGLRPGRWPVAPRRDALAACRGGPRVADPQLPLPGQSVVVGVCGDDPGRRGEVGTVPFPRQESRQRSRAKSGWRITGPPRNPSPPTPLPASGARGDRLEMAAQEPQPGRPRAGSMANWRRLVGAEVDLRWRPIQIGARMRGAPCGGAISRGARTVWPRPTARRGDRPTADAGTPPHAEGNDERPI